MKIGQIQVKKSSNIDALLEGGKNPEAQLVLAFGQDSYFANLDLGKKLKGAFPGATILGCSTAGEISKDGVQDDTLTVTVCQFNQCEFHVGSAVVLNMDESLKAGSELARGVLQNRDSKELNSLFVLGPGLNINGSGLISGLREVLGKQAVITGGLAGDGGKFQKTYTLLNDQVFSDRAVAFGLFGKGVQIGFGSFGGWEPFGPVRKVTKSKANVLYELDGQPALDLYKKYLGDEAKNLPASGLLYPFSILKDNQDQTGLIRTILAVDENEKSLTFAGDIPSDALVRLMHSSTEQLINGARSAASKALGGPESDSTQLAVLISCVGRKLVMGSDIDDEVDMVQEIFGKKTVLTGFYSYGEICPDEMKECKLHNQTMTISYFYENGL